MTVPLARPQIPSHRPNRPVLLPFLLIAATILTLWPVCTAEFTSWDDLEAISANPTMLPPTWHSVAEWWTKPAADLWIPVTYTTWGLLALVAQKHGANGPSLNSYVFHTANLLLHVLAMLVVFRLLELLVRRRWPAAAGAALFALHPVQVEPVAWAAGMKDVLYGLLALVAIWQYLLAAQAPLRAGVYDSGLPPENRPRHWHYTFATAAFALALLSKPTAVIVPLIAAALEWAMAARRPPAANRRRWKGTGWRLGLWLAMAVPIILVAHHVQPLHRSSDYVPFAQRPMVAFDALAFYVGKILLPLHLSMDYGRAPWKIFDDGQAYWTWIVPAALVGALLAFGRRRPMLLAGAAVFVLGLLPVLGFVGFDFQGVSTVADHYLYLPMFGVALMAASSLALPGLGRQAKRVGAVALVVFALLAWRSFALAWSWHTSESLFAHTLAENPLSTVANDSLSVAADNRGDWAQAIAYARTSIRGNPHRPHGWVLLSNGYALKGQSYRAVEAMSHAYQLAPDDPQVEIDMGVQLTSVGRFAEAAARNREALRLDPKSAAAELNLAIDLGALGDVSGGLAHVQRAARIDPVNPATQLTLGDFLLQLGRKSEAKTAFELALRLKPGFGPAIDRLAQLQQPTTRPSR